MLPWQVICTAHVFDSNHHNHEGPSSCELHRIAAQQEGQHILPPMDCEHVSSAIDGYTQPQVEKIVPTVQMVAMAVVLFDLVKFDIQEQSVFLPPIPNCRSATLLSDSPLRGPPLV